MVGKVDTRCYSCKTSGDLSAVDVTFIQGRETWMLKIVPTFI